MLSYDTSLGEKEFMILMPKQLLLWFALAGVYYLTALLGLSLAFEQANTSPVWPPTGIAIAALLHFGLRVWPGIFLGALIANLVSGTSVEVSIAIAVGNTLEGIVAYFLIHRFVGENPFLSINQIVKFVFIVILATMLSASIGVTSLVLGNIIQWEKFTLLWSTWWLGDVVGALVVTPFVLQCFTSKSRDWLSFLTLDAFMILIITFVSTAFVFSHWSPFSQEHYPLSFIYLPIAIWVAYRLNQLGVTLFIVTIASFAICGTLLGYGPFVRLSANESLLLLQGFMGVMMMTTLILWITVNDSKQANQKLADRKKQLTQKVQRQTGDLETAADELKLAESVFNESVQSIMITDKDANILRVNPAFVKTTGYTADEVLGKNPRLLKSGRHDICFYRDMWNSLISKHYWEGEIWDKRKNGEVFPTWQTITSVAEEQSEVIQYISIFSDISEKKTSEERIYHLAHYDNLTNLRNRAAFHEQLEIAIAYANRQQYQLAVLYLDLDNFKIINDASGHPVGDLLLQHFARRLENTVRDEDTIARLGGDEFVILIVDVHNNQDAALVAQKILHEMEKPILLDHTEVVVTGSIGISTYPEDGVDADTLLKNADVAMYKAKEKGRNTFQFFTAKMNEQAEERLLLENDMRRALVNEEFLLHYQPQLDLNSGEIIGCEALVRWRHPERGLIGPDVFIPIAEESGLIRELGRWVLQTACEQQHRWQEKHPSSLTVAVNISSRQFLSQHLILEIKQIIEAASIKPNHLELELTESIIMDYVEENILILQQLHDMGVKLAVDDFGTGYSSMAYLKRFPIDKLKIDQGFVRDIATDPDDAAIVKAITLLAQSLNIKVIAEGVETVEQLDYLTEIGCDEMQGFYFSRPVPTEEFEALIRKNTSLRELVKVECSEDI